MEEYVVGMENRTESLTRQLATVVEQQQKTLSQLSLVFSGEDARPGERDRLNAQLQRLMAQFERLNEEVKLARLEGREIAGRRRLRHSGRTLREQTLDILDEIAVPMAPSAIVEFASATSGVSFATSRFASLRRDEERASRRDFLAKPAWVAPALSSNSLTSVPRLLTSTAWSAERRLIGPRTPRVNHLRAILAYLRRHELLQTIDPRRAKILLDGLIWRHARAVPGATKSGELPDLAHIRHTINAELSLIEPEDEAERKNAAERLKRLAPAFQCWGKPALVEGDALSGMRA
jgi:hypothetical protein